ncbi:MAG: DUF4339 domain-containing protein [Planctomycetaceae bacterium]|nr:DUF4339 domain-containing protein [Planctomycetaceae bacterium]
MTEYWYVQRNNSRQGPLSSQQLIEMVQQGKVSRNTLVRRDGNSKWYRAENIGGLFSPAVLEAKPSSQKPSIEPVTSSRIEPPPLPVQVGTKPRLRQSHPKYWIGGLSLSAILISLLLLVIFLPSQISSFRTCLSLFSETVSLWNSGATDGAFEKDLLVHAESISRVMAEDRKRSVEAQNFEEIPQNMRQIDLSGCPNEFRAAYLAHIHSWEAAVQVLIEFKEFQEQSKSGAAFVESMLRGYMGDPFGKTLEVLQTNQELEKRYKTAREGIQTSYRRLEELAVLFGAQLLPPQTTNAQ